MFHVEHRRRDPGLSEVAPSGCMAHRRSQVRAGHSAAGAPLTNPRRRQPTLAPLQAFALAQCGGDVGHAARALVRSRSRPGRSRCRRSGELLVELAPAAGAPVRTDGTDRLAAGDSSSCEPAPTGTWLSTIRRPPGCWTVVVGDAASEGDARASPPLSGACWTVSVDAGCGSAARPGSHVRYGLVIGQRGSLLGGPGRGAHSGRLEAARRGPERDPLLDDASSYRTPGTVSRTTRTTLVASTPSIVGASTTDATPAPSLRPTCLAASISSSALPPFSATSEPPATAAAARAGTAVERRHRSHGHRVPEQSPCSSCARPRAPRHCRGQDLRHLAEPRRPSLHGLEENDLGLREHRRDDDARQAGPAPEVDDPSLAREERHDRGGVQQVPFPQTRELPGPTSPRSSPWDTSRSWNPSTAVHAGPK